MIIGLTGYMHSGKTTISQILQERHGFVRERFAGPLKSMLAAIGLTENQLDGDEKEITCDLLGGQTPRLAMQTLGTEWGRQLIHPDLWTMLWTQRAKSHDAVVTDDVRFPDEADLIREMGGVVWRVSRAECMPTGHISEQHIATLPADFEIVNDGSIEDMADIVEILLKKYGWRDAR